ncbi:MAG: hypothetical protein HKN77_09130 [Woeseiaceae bacterium]|nr:hypothetical protein [Woeseiaceae bacterium]
MIRRDYNMIIVTAFRAVLSLVAALLFFALDANAVDGNYSSPYGSQYDTRSTSASLPDATLAGTVLVILNFAVAVFYSLRNRVHKKP